MPSILITGVSSGIGRACAARFASEGWAVAGTVRDTAGFPAGVEGCERLFDLDLGHPGAPGRLATRILSGRGCPDVILNNAGAVTFGPLEHMSDEELKRLFQVNFFGQMELIRGFLPAMRERRSGTIANITSLGGRITFPFFGAYNSSKWAFEGASEGLWHEVRPFGIKVKAIEPGFVETAVWGKLPPVEESPPGQEAYLPYTKAMRAFEAAITTRTTPAQAADEVFRAVTDSSDRLRYPVAAYARPIIAARRLLGDRAVMRFFHRRWMGEG